MKLSLPWKKIVRRSALTLLALLLALAAWVPIQQQILRWRAERLLADIRAIQMGKSNWDDAQRLMHRWGAWNEQLDNCLGETLPFPTCEKPPLTDGGFSLLQRTSNNLAISRSSPNRSA